MDPATIWAVKAGAGLLAGRLKTLFKEHVIDKWTKRRAEAFFETFVERLVAAEKAKQPIGDLGPMLAEMLDDEAKSEAMFDAYRRVSMSASKDLGPRIIAVITARLISQERQATPQEERLFMAAETLNDAEFSEFSEYISSHPINNNNMIEIWSDLEYSSDSRTSVIVSPSNLGESVGNWCLKISNLGLVAECINKKSEIYSGKGEGFYGEDSGIHTIYTGALEFEPEALELKALVEELRTEASKRRHESGEPDPVS